MSPHARATRIALGFGLVVLGCAIFAVSKARDPQNRAAVLGIIAILWGMSWMGQGLRGRLDAAPERSTRTGTARRTGTVRVSAERTVAGVLLAWVVPGLGHWLIGRRAKALLFFFVITLTFVAGVALAKGRNLNYERDSIYFLTYAFNLGETALGWFLTRGLELDRKIRFLELGFLYTAIACLLNLVVMMDFIASCIGEGHGEKEAGGGN